MFQHHDINSVHFPSPVSLPSSNLNLWFPFPPLSTQSSFRVTPSFYYCISDHSLAYSRLPHSMANSFYVLVLVNTAGINIERWGNRGAEAFSTWDLYFLHINRTELLYHTKSLFVIFEETVMLFSSEAAPVYISPTVSLCLHVFIKLVSYLSDHR